MTDLTILQLNDLHGYISPHPEFVYDHDAGFRTVTLGGLARIRTLFDRARDENPGGVIALDNGDSFHGTHFAVSDQGEAMAPLLDAVGFDAMTLHWEFAYGPARVRELGAKLRHPMLAANIHDEGDGSLFTTPWTMLERKGRRIAVIGLACPIVDKTMPPSYSEGIRFSIGNEELPGHIRDARADGAELVVVLSHVGFPQDVKLAREVDGIDVLVSGHTHNRTERAVEVNGAVIFQSGCHGSFIGRLDLTLGRDGVESYRHRLIPVSDDLPEDEELSGMVRSAHEAEPDELGEVVGSVEVPLHRYAMLGAPMDDLLLDAVAEAGGTRIAFSNGWRYGVPVRAGPVTLEDLWRIIPTNPPVSRTTLTGAELRRMLEDNLHRTFAADPYEQMGGYIKRMRGVRMVFKAENPRGTRIQELIAEDEEVRDDREYRVSFVTAQGVPESVGRDRENLDVDAITALRNRLAAGPWAPRPGGDTCFLG